MPHLLSGFFGCVYYAAVMEVSGVKTKEMKEGPGRLRYNHNELEEMEASWKQCWPLFYAALRNGKLIDFG